MFAVRSELTTLAISSGSECTHHLSYQRYEVLHTTISMLIEGDLIK